MPGKKQIVAQIKLQVTGGQANPSPPVGPALGQHGLNIMDFCKQFNERTKEHMGVKVPVVITVFQDKSFSFITKTPPAAVLIKQTIKLDSGSAVPNKNKVGKLSRTQLTAIAKQKMSDLNAASLEAATTMIAGTARSMGVEIVD